MYVLGTHVVSTRTNTIHGVVVGYGFIEWPSNADLDGDSEPRAVYLLQVQDNSSSAHSHACHVILQDHAEKVAVS